MALSFPTEINVPAENAGLRLDQFLAAHFPDASRSRLQTLIAEGKVSISGRPAKASLRMKGGEKIEITGAITVPPLRAIAEDIPLDVVYEDNDLAIINKPAGMMVHAGAGATDDLRNRGTLVNALLHRFGQLSEVSGELRPGIVHRLDKATSGLIVVAKNDATHRALGSAFSKRRVEKTYIALVHGWPDTKMGTITSKISRDTTRRTRMTTRGRGGREAVTRYKAVRFIVSPWGKFALLEVKIETGRTHQIRVHMASVGHPVVGDVLYGAPGQIRAGGKVAIALERNFLHAAELKFRHPTTGEEIVARAALPGELEEFVRRVEAG